MKNYNSEDIYTIFIAKFRGPSGRGFYRVDFISEDTEKKLDTKIKKYLDNNSEMFLDRKLKQLKLKFKYNSKIYDLLMEEEDLRNNLDGISSLI